MYFCIAQIDSLMIIYKTYMSSSAEIKWQTRAAIGYQQAWTGLSQANQGRIG